MALTTESYRLVEAYYRGELAPAEEEKLRARIREDEAFAADVREWEAVFQAMRPTAEELSERKQLRQRYRDLRGEEQATAPPAVRRLPRWWAVAAAVLLVAALSVWLLRDTPDASAPPAQASRYLFMGRENALLGKDTVTQATLQDAYEAYDALDYAAAAPVLLSREGIAADSLSLLYGGVARLNLGETEAAIAALEGLLPSSYYEDFLPEINYYLGEAYRAAGREDDARERLALAAAEPGKFGEAARAALEE